MKIFTKSLETQMKLRRCWIMALLFIYSPTFGQDTTGVDIGRGYTLRADFIPFGNVIRASDRPDEQLETSQFAGSGASLSIMKGRYIGLSLSLLLYSGSNKKVYPVIASGPVLRLHRLLAISLGWDFGKVESNFDSAYKRRLLLLTTLSYPIDLE